ARGPAGALPDLYRGLQGAARAAPRRRSAAPAERQARLPPRQGTGAGARGHRLNRPRLRSPTECGERVGRAVAGRNRGGQVSSGSLRDRWVGRRGDPEMTYRPVRRAVLLPTVIAVALAPFFSALISTTIASAPAAAATVTTHTPVMG